MTASHSISTTDLSRKFPLAQGPITTVRLVKRPTLPDQVVFNERQFFTVAFVEDFLNLDVHILDVSQDGDVITFTVGVDEHRAHLRQLAREIARPLRPKVPLANGSTSQHTLEGSDTPAPAWLPTCPTCHGQMEVKRQRNDGSNDLFWSCRNFPHCRGRADFQPHPDDVTQASGDGRQALYLTFERAQAAGLIGVSAGARRRRRQTDLQTARLQAAMGR